ncbi:aromatic acid exporter family protein [Gordonia jinhuaensis]|uniref:Integral membrane bound transporter domain-containing protein n=1 Tax=Gordonia jinhuaensis TaxID=1517702 RepID=A0A916T9B7_9ACTN|nr:FUSC family protein [Gordonia jinhuaensis]GGB36689.1 hypothetical protein GCM10011489_25760 [Gordonia jinhuaensis]
MSEHAQRAWRSSTVLDRLRSGFHRLPVHVRAPLRRLYFSLLPITQCALAAALAWFIAQKLIGHTNPFFAPIAAVISLGTSLGQRWRRSFEMVVGVSVGIGVGDLIVKQIGSGTWQIAVVVALAMSVATLLDRSPLVGLQAASSACLVATLLPPGGSGGINRMIDAFVGGVVGILVVALIPTHPVRRARRDAANVMETMRGVVVDTAQGLRDRDHDLVSDALHRARGTQSAIDAMRSDMSGGRDISRISPLYWNSRERLARLNATADPIDNAVRNIRVLCRRALGSLDDGTAVSPRVIDLVAELGGAFEVLRDMLLADPGDHPDEADAARVLRHIAREARAELVEDSGLSETVILGQIRSTLVDLLMVAGLRRTSAVATLR